MTSTSKEPFQFSAYRSGEALHTAGYLWPGVLRLLEGTGAKRVLDAGCGNGALARALFERG